ncbi:MAG: 23S rRNA (pseudouridine(1915)-N(3))-methyltransferase RlmH [Lachnospiraceae bacterium]|nr:23S rRNA (pseudouridine(1915)-N(3))-methyltransferase RlmH [Lachnospiraceae bacterium]
MKYTVVCVGKIKEKFYAQAVEEYVKRLSRYGKTEIIEVADEKTPEQASETVNRMIKDKEGERILAQIKEDTYVIALAIEGQMLDSEELAEKMEMLAISGISHIVFVIGGSLGLSQKVMKRADYHLSFSRMTFPHQLMRVILLEQIYRGCRIIHHEPYHK